MKLKERLFSNMFYRNMLTVLGFRSSYSPIKNEQSFFQYKMGAHIPRTGIHVQSDRLDIFNKIILLAKLKTLQL
jgi:hypothetical protein